MNIPKTVPFTKGKILKSRFKNVKDLYIENYKMLMKQIRQIKQKYMYEKKEY